MPNPINVAFKRGLHKDLPTGSNVVDGSFYLTTDTNRLYVGQGNTLVELNKSIHTINSISELPTTDASVNIGQFYYITSKNDNQAENTHKGNILAVCTNIVDHVPQWTQVNPDTNNRISDTYDAVSAVVNNGTATIVTTINDDGGTMRTAQGTFDIVPGNGNITITQGTGRSNPNSTINIPQINISAKDTTYTLSAQNASTTGQAIIRLTDDTKASGVSGRDQDITLIGDGGISISKDTGNTIKISGANPISGIANSFSATTGQFTTTVAISGSDSITSQAIVPTIKYGREGTSTAVFDGSVAATPTATLNVYTKNEIDNLISSSIQTADAMTYKGTVSASNAGTILGEASTTDPTKYKGNVGDTYKAFEKITSPVSAEIGDLIIAEGVDGAVLWSVIPSGNDQFVSINLDSSQKAFTVQDNLATSNLGSIIFQNDNTAGNSIIDVQVEVPQNNSTALIVTPKHGLAGAGTAVTATRVTNAHTQGTSAFEVPIVTGISKDVHGHITSVTLDTYSFNHGSIDNDSLTHGFTLDQGNIHKGYFSTAFSFDGVGQNAKFGISSNSLTLSQTTETILNTNVSGINIELVWGTF